MTSTTRLAVLALLAAVALAACGGSASAPTATPPSATDAPVTGAPATGAPATDTPAETPAVTPDGPAPSTPTAVDPAVVDSIDACALLTADEVATAFGVPVDSIQPMTGSTALPGNRSCFYRPPGVADGPQVNVAALAIPDYSRPAKPAPAPGLEDASGAWWIDTLTGDLKLEAVAPNGVRLTLAYQDTAADASPTDADLAFLVPLTATALGRLP